MHGDVKDGMEHGEVWINFEGFLSKRRVELDKINHFNHSHMQLYLNYKASQQHFFSIHL